EAGERPRRSARGARPRRTSASRGDPARTRGNPPLASPASELSGSKPSRANWTGRGGRATVEAGATKEQRRRRREDEEAPVFGMGDHVPMFLQRPARLKSE